MLNKQPSERESVREFLKNEENYFTFEKEGFRYAIKNNEIIIYHGLASVREKEQTI